MNKQPRIPCILTAEAPPIGPMRLVLEVPHTHYPSLMPMIPFAEVTGNGALEIPGVPLMRVMIANEIAPADESSL